MWKRGLVGALRRAGTSRPRCYATMSSAVDSMILRSKMNMPPRVSPPSPFSIVKGALDSNGPVLKRSYGEEEVTVYVMRRDGDDGQLCIHVDVSKPTQNESLIFLCGLYEDALGIHSVSMRPKLTEHSGSIIIPSQYTGPVFAELNERTRDAFQSYIEERGVNESLFKFLQAWLYVKEHRNLDAIESCLDAMDLTLHQDFEVLEKMLDAKTISDGEKVGNILAWLCKGKKVKEAHAVYKAAIEKGKYPPMHSVNLLVGKLSHENETVPLALEMLKDIPGDMRKHAIKPFSAVVRALCRVKDVGTAKQLILDMIADGPPPGNAVFNFVITGYSKVGEMGQAMEMMKLLESRGLKPDVYTYVVIASGYSNGGEMEAAGKILEEAKKNHSVLSPVMYHSLVRGYCKMEQFDEALKLLAEMKDFGVRISVDEYDKLIQSLCLKAMDWETAEKLQAEMKENGLYLKGVTRALIRAVKEMENEVVEA